MDVFATWLDEDEEKHLLQKHQEAKVGSAADEKMQEKIQKALDRLPKERKCPKGYAWVQNPTGFTCAAGGHSISLYRYCFARIVYFCTHFYALLLFSESHRLVDFRNMLIFFLPMLLYFH
ncbi:hypothetical protein BDR06DRAFT_961226 [Suillus hirtellus]|nr:hypothetical protein BDR06DRAFT_961226 [Suillus hirtellus]